MNPLPLRLRCSAAAVMLALSAWSLESLAQLQPSSPLRTPQRLSSWLLEQDPQGLAYASGLSWRLPEEQPAQLALKLELLQYLGRFQATGGATGGFNAEGLTSRLAAMPVTGRIPVASGDARWLEGNPQRDPWLMPGHRVDLPARPMTVSLLTPEGLLCRVEHVPGQEVSGYVRACAALNGIDVDWAWLAQPDGRVDRYGIANWNTTAQDTPAPGAWIWAPPRKLPFSERFSSQLIRFLATQGPAPDAGVPSAVVPQAAAQPVVAGSPATGLRWSAVSRELLDPQPRPSPDPVLQRVPEGLSGARARDAMLTTNDWGLVGALQTPSARMRSAGSFALSTSKVEPYTRWNVVAQPFSWMEAGFRYTDVGNRVYDLGNLPNVTQSYKDKSFDVKFGLWAESTLLPEMSVGFIDPAGTGLFSSEYLVVSKRWVSFDFSAGLAWGYLAGKSRQQFITGTGGNFSFNQYFSGTARPFGSVQWMTPWQSLLLKVEYDSNNYQNEPLGNRFEQSSRLNFGLVYRPYSWLDMKVGFERGNQVMLGLSINSDLSKLSMTKLSDPARLPVVAARPDVAPDWTRTARDLGVQTGWPVSTVRREGAQVVVTVNDPEAVYWQDRVDRAASVLHRDAPADVDRFVLHYRARGLELSEQVIDRERWVATQTQPLPASQQREVTLAREASSPDTERKLLFEAAPDPWRSSFRVGLGQTLGGPDSAVLYQVFAEQSVQLRLFGRQDTWLSGALRYNMLNNYDRFKYTAPSNLPRVRTFMREYLTTSDLTLPNLQVTHVRQVSANQYVSGYAGYLEEMFAGFGGEWLYRPFASRIALGIDANLVRQRGFEQNFQMLAPNYEVATGHATLYWDTGWNGVDVRASVGRYLARDIGATLEVSRRFSNGIILGAFATKTNVSAEQFGEGSFDKGLFIGIPFDAFMTRSSGTMGFFNWKPLTRDGGAKLWRQQWLYDMTRTRDLRTFGVKAASAVNENARAVEQQPNWQPPAELAPVTATLSATAPLPDVAWRGEAGPSLRLAEALDREGFRNTRIEYDGAHRLNLKLAHERIKPLSRAAGRAVRIALAHAPAGVRELRLQLAEHNESLVEYDFFDLARLRAFFAGEITLANLQPAVAVRYLHAGAREADPLALLGDTAVVPAILPLREVIPGAVVQEPRRVLDDVAGAAKSLGRVDWLNAAGISLLAVGGSSLLDSRAQQFARDHAGAGWLKSLNRVGDALPWVGLAGAGLLALDGSDPRRARTALSAAESGVTAAVAATGLKYVFGRPRPNSGFSRNDFSPGDGNRDSMPSRHAAVAWAVATPFAEEYRAPWIYGLAAITNLSRVGKQQHWFSDTVAGSLLGYGVGRLFWESGRGNQQMPQVFVDPSGVNMHWSFR